MSIERRGSKFLARWEAHHPEDPKKRMRLAKSFDTEDKARMYLCNAAPKEHRWDLNRPLHVSLKAWIEYRRDTGAINAKTAERQLGIADNFRRTIANKTVEKVTTEDVQSAISAMAAGTHRPRQDGTPGRKLSLRTRRQHLTVLGQFYAAKLAGAHLRINPVAAVARPSVPIEDPKEPSEEQVGALLERLTERSAANGNLSLLVTLLEVTGLRRGEALALARDAFDRARKTVRITKSLMQTKEAGLQLKQPKSEKGTREIEVPDWFFPLLAAHFDRLDAQKALLGPAYVDRGLVFPDAFGGYLKPDTVSGQIAEAKRKAGWPHGVHGLHGLRHKFASHLAHSGEIPVKDLAHVLGHADEAFTLRVYVKRKRQAPPTSHLFPPPRSRQKKPDGEAAAGSD